MSECCTDNRFELIEKYKQKLIDGTNIEMAPDEMAVIDDILFRFWQMGWLDKLDADVVPVVRCKDCKHLLIVTNEPLMGLCRLSAPKTLTMWEEDIATHFCGWGERKDDE